MHVDNWHMLGSSIDDLSVQVQERDLATAGETRRCTGLLAVLPIGDTVADELLGRAFEFVIESVTVDESSRAGFARTNGPLRVSSRTRSSVMCR